MSIHTTQLPMLLFIPHSTALLHATYFGEVQEEDGVWHKAGFAIEKPEDALNAIGFRTAIAYRVRDVSGTIIVEGQTVLGKFLEMAP